MAATGGFACCAIVTDLMCPATCASQRRHLHTGDHARTEEPMSNEFEGVEWVQAACKAESNTRRLNTKQEC